MEFIKGANAGTTKLEYDRAQKQRELTNKIRGFELNRETNEYVANERGRKFLEKQMQQLILDNNYLKEQQQVISAIQNQNSMTESVSHLSMGEHEDAWKVIEKNPVLKQQLKDKFGVQNISAVDWNKDKSLFEGTGITITDEMIKDDVTRKALDSSIYKVLGTDGKFRLGSTADLIRKTNTLEYLPTSKKQAAIKRFNRINEVISGHHVMTDSEDIANEAVLAEKTSASRLNTLASDSRMQTLEKMLKENPNMTLSSAMGQLDGTNYKIKKLAADADKAVFDAEKSKYATKKARQESHEDIGNTSTLIDAYNDIETTKLSREQEKQLRYIEKNDAPKDLKNIQESVKSKIQFGSLFRKMASKVEELDGDALSVLKAKVGKYFEQDTESKRNKILQQIKVTTGIGALMASYIKDMSGAAVTDSEREMYGEILTSDKYSDSTTMATALREFSKTVEMEANEKIRGLTYSAPWTYRRLNDMLNKSASSDNSVTSKKTKNKKVETRNITAKNSNTRKELNLDDFKINMTQD